jgi:hypothetical protein
VAAWLVDWWIGADDRWHIPRREVAVRQVLVDEMPVVQTSLRVPGGDAIARVYGARTEGDVVVFEIENASPAPFVLALVVDGAFDVELHDTTLYVDGRAALRGARPPSRHAASHDSVEPVVTRGGAALGPLGSAHDPRGRLEVALLYPVTHRTTLRIEVAASRDGLPQPPTTPLPGAAAVARAWRAQLDRGMRLELPEPAWNAAVDAARAGVLLAAQEDRPQASAVASLEDWGFDAEALASWRRLPARERRAARRRDAVSDWDDVELARERDDSAFLLALRGTVLAEERDILRVLPAWPARWRGAGVDVRDAPTIRGPLSFSVRWHGDRPALLWDAPPGVVLTAPGLDPGWRTDRPSGEALLEPGGAAQG